MTAPPTHTLKTKWFPDAAAGKTHREYPRPQMVRKNWTNLNGEWMITVRHDGEPGTGIEHPILVPFPIESQLSGASSILNRADGTQDASQDVFTYTRTFERPKGERILLHFGAVNWKSSVRVNGKVVGDHTGSFDANGAVVGDHKGGYDGFTFDITQALTQSGPQTLQVEVSNPIDSGTQPRGKQVRKPGGIFYTASTGIWQTVWLEAVPSSYIEKFIVAADRKRGHVQVAVTPEGVEPAGKGGWQIPGKGAGSVRIEVSDGGRIVATKVVSTGSNDRATPEHPLPTILPTEIELSVSGPREWSPEDPHLYDLTISMLDSKGKVVDQVRSYFAFRDISLINDASGQPHFALNGKPYFLIGTLDQGFWPDGLYTAPSDEALKYDLDVTKRLGFNMVRKHVKVEPDRWYYWCDMMGLIVMQDMPSGDKFIGPNDPDIKRTKNSANDFMRELDAMVEGRQSHPCIGAWVLYNEGWGQWDTAEQTTRLQRLVGDVALVNSTTGWADRGVGAFNDIHSYPGPDIPSPDSTRCLFLGEFGGLGLPEPGHMWQETGWGYQSFKTSKELTDRFVGIFAKLRELKAKGLSGAIYTQTTDCETELNGLMTYDRAMVKMDEKRARQAIESVRDGAGH